MAHQPSDPAPRLLRRGAVVAAAEYDSCRSCGVSDVLLLEGTPGPRCLNCADLGHLQFLPSGNAALSRRVTKAGEQSIAVMRRNIRRQRLDRHGLLAEPAAIEHGARAFLADAPPVPRMTPQQRHRAARVRRLHTELAAAIHELFPGCPVERAEAIALHTAVTSKGDLGRNVDDVALDAAARRAVSASVRHIDTNYAELMKAGSDRYAAGAQVRQRVGQVLAAWRDGVTMLD